MVPAPATVPGSLSEGAAERSEAEGVSSDGSTGPMVYPQAIIDSEIFERIRSSKYTPSVSHSLDSSLREGAGTTSPTMPITRPLTKYQRAGDFWGFCVGVFLPFNRVLAKPWGWRAIFIAPTKALNVSHFTIHRGTLPPVFGGSRLVFGRTWLCLLLW